MSSTPFAVDDVIRQYHRAARELWKFCWLGGAGGGVERTARILRDMASADERAVEASWVLDTAAGTPALLSG